MPDAYARALSALRLFQDRFAGARPNEDMLGDLELALIDWNCRLAQFSVPEAERFSGNRPDLPARGRSITPPLDQEVLTLDAILGIMTLGNAYLGTNGAVHGGVVSLIFDDILGRLVNNRMMQAQGAPARTAFLTVNYKAITPVNVPLAVRGEIVRQDGRKCFVRGEIWHGETLCADADALFVILREGQP